MTAVKMLCARVCWKTDLRPGTARLLVHTACTALHAEGIAKVALVVFDRNQCGNAFRESSDFGSRSNLIYRNKVISEVEMRRMNT
jgi:hypothetical protein